MIKGVRAALDGTFWHPNPSKELVEIMDAEFDRLPNEYRWVPRPAEAGNALGLKMTDTVYIIGSGPSIDSLNQSHFKRGCTVLCINYSLSPIENLGLDNQLYGIQMDAYSCKGKSPRLLSYQARYCYPANKNYLFTPQVMKGCPLYTSGAAAILAEHCGAKKIIFYGMDAQITGNLTYSDEVAKEVGRKDCAYTQGYLLQAHAIRRMVNCEVIFRTPHTQTTCPTIEEQVNVC